MQIQMDNVLIKKLLKDVESQLNWDESKLWTTHDFEELSERILKKTTINLSVTTLKRLWGKINYDSKPTITTLNTLAQFISFNNWREYKQNSGLINKKEDVEKSIEKKRGIQPKRLVIGSIGIFFLILTMFFILKSEKEIVIEANKYSFSSKKVVSEGVPNSVIFNYNTNEAKTFEKVEIQKSWDERLRIEVPKDKKIHNSIYYYPGYFKAKLLVADSIMKEEAILIKTDGWLPLIEKDETKPPIYFKKEDIFKKNGVMTLPIEKIKEANVELMPKPTWTTFFNINDFNTASFSDNFLFETEVKNDYDGITSMCQYINIVLYFEGAMLYIPFSYKGCVSSLSLYDTNGLMDVDVSALGFELNQWIKIKIEVKDEVGKIFINDKFEYDFNFHFEKPAKFVGVKYNFQGTGSVNYTKFINGDNIAVFEENY